MKVRHVDFYADEWLAGTMELSEFERGIYITAVALIYSRGGPIERIALRRLCPSRGPRFDRALERLFLLGKLISNCSLIDNKRASKELQNGLQRISKASQNGLKGGRPPNKNNELAKPDGFQNEKLTTNHQPPTTNQNKDKSALRADFAAWYAAYPRKVAPAKAEQAYYRARREGASAAELLDGIERYRTGKPTYADWQTPAPWLNGRRWLDDYGDTDAEPSRDRPTGPPPPLRLAYGG